MSAGAEGEAGVEAQQQPLRVLRYRLPAGEDEQLFAYLYGLVVLLPVLGPVLVGHDARLRLEPRAVREGGETRAALGRVLHVELDAGNAAVARLQLLVHVVPVLPVLLEKAAEVRLVLYDQPVRTQLRELFAQGVDVLRMRPEGRLYPLHM